MQQVNCRLEGKSDGRTKSEQKILLKKKDRTGSLTKYDWIVMESSGCLNNPKFASHLETVLDGCFKVNNNDKKYALNYIYD